MSKWTTLKKAPESMQMLKQATPKTSKATENTVTAILKTMEKKKRIMDVNIDLEYPVHTLDIVNK